jgi:hypothetical protein
MMLKKYLQRIVLIAIAFFSVKTGVNNFMSNININSNDTAVAIWDERLSKLIALIPFERGFIGYVSIEDIPGATFNAADTSGEFVLTQYAVAPFILIRGADQEWNILNLDPENYENWMQTNAGNFKLVEAGGNVYLIRKVDK